MSSGNYKWKQWDHQTLIRMYRIWNTDTTICWRGYGAVGTPTPCWWECRMGLPLWNSFAISYKTKHTLVVQSNSHILRYLPRWAENLHPQRNLHIKVYSSFMDNCQNLEATKKPNSRWTDKQILVCPYNEMLFRHLQKKSYQATKWQRTEANMKRLRTVWFQLYDILEKAKLQRLKRKQGLPGVGGDKGWMNRRSIEDF